MKGQFFIISTIIIVSALIIVTQYLYDYSKVDLTRLQENQELDYIHSVKNSLISTVDNSRCDRLDADLKGTETFLKDQMIRKGIILNVSHNIVSCPETNFEFNITSSDFSSTTEFTYP